MKIDHPTDLALETVDPLPPETERYFRICEEKLGIVPNVLKAYAHDIERLNLFAALYNNLMLAESGLSKLEREMIAVAVSSVNRCFYCLVAHGAAVRSLSGDPALGEALVMNYRVEEPDRQALRDAGFGEKDIWDIAETAAFFNMTNRMASATNMAPNPEYHAEAR